MEERQEIKSLKKALRALAYLNQAGEATVSAVAKAIRVPRTTSYRLLETLAAEGYIEKQPHCDVYRLTSLVKRLSSGFADRDLVVEVASPLVANFGRSVGWPIALSTPRGADMIVRITTDYDTTLAIDRYMVGFTVPILYSPSGLCYLAYCEDHVRSMIIELSDNNKSPRLKGASSDEDSLRRTLDGIRQNGFCNIRFAEFSEGGLAVPLIIEGRAFGAIVMRYIKASVPLEQIQSVHAPKLRDLAVQVEAAFIERAHEQ